MRRRDLEKKKKEAITRIYTEVYILEKFKR